MKPVDTKRVRKLLEAHRCRRVGTEGSHEKWETSNGLSAVIVAGHKQQSPGVLRDVQAALAPELGERWLEKGLRK